MIPSPFLPASRRLPLIAGCSLLLMALVAGFAYGYVIQPLNWHDDATAIQTAVQDSLPLFRWGIAGFILILILDIIVAWSLYYLFALNSKTLALLASWLRLVYAALLGIGITQLLAALREAGRYHTGIGLFEDKGVVYYLEMFDATWSMALILAGFHLFVLGLVLLRSGSVPRIMGWLAILAALCYTGTSLGNLLWPGYRHYRLLADQWLSIPMAAGELPFALWLVFKAGKGKSREKGTIAAALSAA